MSLLIAVILGVAVVVSVLYWLRRPVRHRNVMMSEFERYFGAWIGKLANGGLVFAREEDTGHFVQFAIYRSEGASVVQFALPDAEWSEKLFERVHVALTARGFDAKIEPTQVEEVKRFLVCDLPANRNSIAQDVADVARIALTAMGHSESRGFTVWAEGDFDPKSAIESCERLTQHPSPHVRRWAKGRLRRIGRER